MLYGRRVDVWTAESSESQEIVHVLSKLDIYAWGLSHRETWSKLTDEYRDLVVETVASCCIRGQNSLHSLSRGCTACQTPCKGPGGETRELNSCGSLPTERTVYWVMRDQKQANQQIIFN